MKLVSIGVAVIAATLAPLMSVKAQPVVLFNTGNPDGLMAMASRPQNGSNIEIEAADDFLFASSVSLTGATFVGLIPSGATISGVDVEIYRVFPQDSDTTRMPHVPTRVNSPSDVAFDSRDSAASTLTFMTTILSASFTASNSVLNGINPSPNQTTGGEGSVTGQEVQFTVTFTTPIALPPNHYFFIPQVQLNTGNFFWLSAPRPIVSGTPFTPDLQAWIRNANLDPDWLRVGTDIVGSGAFNGAFSLSGVNVATPTPTNTPTGTPPNAPTNTPTGTPPNAPTNTPTGTPPNAPTNTPTSTPLVTPTSTRTSTPTPPPVTAVQVPTLSSPVLALLGLALLGMGFLLSRRP